MPEAWIDDKPAKAPRAKKMGIKRAVAKSKAAAAPKPRRAVIAVKPAAKSRRTKAGRG